MRASFCDVLETNSSDVNTVLQGLIDILPIFYNFLPSMTKFVKGYFHKLHE